MPLEIVHNLQRKAAHPQHSAWVAASAGSGKTKVLTDRVLNLLLEGYPPERLLCLTFTKAAAAEMLTRVRENLGRWAILEENDLKAHLESLQGIQPTREKIELAQKLFGLTLDTPGGLKIQTIHSFCQSLLKQFPLESGLSPFFEVIDDTQQQVLMGTASQVALKQTKCDDLIVRFGESTFHEIHEILLKDRATISCLKAEKIDQVLGTISLTPESHLKTLWERCPKADFQSVLPSFQVGSLSDIERGEKLKSLLAQEKNQDWQTYLSLFLTQKGEKRARLYTQKVGQACPNLVTLLDSEASRVEEWLKEWNALEVAGLSKSLLRYGQAFLGAYEALKKEKSLLDYEDLIQKAVALLKDPGCHWVLYKLDGGIDHILVDEAQDTSPAQWEIIRSIAEEFYANAADDPRNRTLFIVGDGKQSIYSFQGADPRVFDQMQKDLKIFAESSGKKWADIDLNTSFRSAPKILELVDAIFQDVTLPAFSVKHLPFRTEAKGYVEFWPLVKEASTDPVEGWQPQLLPSIQQSTQTQLATRIALKIEEWLKVGGPLEGEVHPGDILILVRRRTKFVDSLIRALKSRGMPVAGIDRLWLLEGIGVQDLLKVAEFLILPEDDLTLATILKGPLFSLKEEDLFSLTSGRGETSLWDQLKRSNHFEDVTNLLKDLLSKADFLTPFGLFSSLLGAYQGRKKWQARLGPEVLDSLDEFLNLCMSYQEKHTPTLQGFLEWVSQEIIELKRDLEQRDQIRIMTVHGSKGLQAPIVILPDTTQVPVDLPHFTVVDKALVWLPPQNKDTPFTKNLKDHLRQKQYEEYLRLLYVALTRAENALLVCGWEGKSQGNWYDLVTAGLEKIGATVNPNQGQIIQKYPERGEPQPSFLLPAWLQTKPAPEKQVKILRPSEGDDLPHDMTLSSLGSRGTDRGILIHKLIDHLSKVPVEEHGLRATNLLRGSFFSQQEQDEMLERVAAVFKSFPDFFGPQSYGEVPVGGYIGEAILSGQIDRLVFKDDQILILDFKTHRTLPQDLESIPQAYLRQLAIYQVALSRIYPEKRLMCGLLWTEIPRLDLIPDIALKKFTALIDQSDHLSYTPGTIIQGKGSDPWQRLK